MSIKMFTGLLLTIVLTVTASAETITLSMPEVKASVGDEVEVNVDLDGARNLVAWQFAVVHDPQVLKVTQVDAGSVSEGALLESNFEADGRTWIAGVRVQPVSSAGDLLLGTR